MEDRRAFRAHWQSVRSAFRRFWIAWLVGIAMSSCIWSPAVLVLSRSGLWADVLPGLLGGAAMVAVPLLMFLNAPYWMLGPEAMAARAEAKARRERTVPPVAVSDPVADPELDSVAVVGIAKGVETLVAPISGRPCLGWRVVGHGPAGPIDEADVIPFEVAVSEGTVGVVADAASLRLNVGGASQSTLHAAAIAELERRWTFPRHGRVRVRESILRSGDRVEVEGAPREELRREGYRGQTARPAIGEVPGVPLVISQVG